MNNRFEVVHLKLGNGPACKNKRAHIRVSFEQFPIYFANPEARCKRCERVYQAMVAKGDLQPLT